MSVAIFRWCYQGECNATDLCTVILIPRSITYLLLANADLNLGHADN